MTDARSGIPVGCAPASTAISFEGVGKRYRLGAGVTSVREAVGLGASRLLGGQRARGHDEIWALRDVTFDLPVGEGLGVIGRNGSGKTTMLKLLAGVTRPTVGRIEASGRIGSLIELGAGFHPDLTGRENVFLNGQIMGMSRRTIAARYDEIVDGVWLSTVVTERCPKAVHCMDPFHVVKWATEAVDAVRRELYRAPCYWSRSRRNRAIKGARSILLRNRDDLSSKQSAGLAEIQSTNRPLYRAYLLKEQLRLVFQLPVAEAMRHLDRWLVWARRSQIARFVALAQTINEHRDGIRASIERGASNGRVEAMNTGIRLLARKAYGFHSPDAMIALAMLKHGGLCPPLPGRTRFIPVPA